jgi:hypothetical protein
MKSVVPIHASILVSAFIPACCPQQEKDIVPYVKMGKNGPEYSYQPDGYFVAGSRGCRGYGDKNGKVVDTVVEGLKKP